ncbi:MAG TPA: hypothetical protein VGV87_21420 [Blastocatellia bacterium]|jgi:hypothetical protein|nr:hypothetical protein [Blastocatellia bacterium]
MVETGTKTEKTSIARLILIPALISLAVTILRLAGELGHWSEGWFTTDTQGVVPSGVSWVIGITWLAVPFGIYFAVKLARDGRGPSSGMRSIGYGLLGVVVAAASLFFFIPALKLELRPRLILIWSAMAIAALIQLAAWPALFKTLLAYGLAARIPVVVVMFLAMRGNWGTHYDFVGMPPQFQMSLLPRFFWLAFFPQLIFWVGFTILVGSFSGSIAGSMLHRPKREL